MNSTIRTTIDTMNVPLSEVFFPSIVVCNINLVRRSLFSELGILDNNTLSHLVYQEIMGHPLQGGLQEEARKILQEYNSRPHSEPGVHQACSDMFLLSEWNRTKTFNIPLERDFGTDYGNCCWYTPQINLTEVSMSTREQGLSEPD